MSGGRPSLYDQEIADTICNLLAEGKSLREICRADDTPHVATVCRWLNTHEEFSEQYARAREAQAETLFDEIIHIADSESGVTVVDAEKDPTAVMETVQRARLRIDARKWAASKMNSKRYGDKVTNEMVGKDGGPIKYQSEAELDARIAELQRKLSQSEGE